MQRLDSVAAPQPHWHIAIDQGYGKLIVEKATVYWDMIEAWTDMTWLNGKGQKVWTMVECKDLECVLREMM